jgi:hypothetical protein
MVAVDQEAGHGYLNVEVDGPHLGSEHALQLAQDFRIDFRGWINDREDIAREPGRALVPQIVQRGRLVATRRHNGQVRETYLVGHPHHFLPSFHIHLLPAPVANDLLEILSRVNEADLLIERAGDLILPQACDQQPQTRILYLG